MQMVDPAPPEEVEPARQMDLFDERHPTGNDSQRQAQTLPPPENPGDLSDAELVERTAGASATTVDALGDEIVARALTAAVPALERLWRRFHGFGYHQPFREQIVVLEVLAQLEVHEAGLAIKRILLHRDVPPPLLPAALRAAAIHTLELPTSFVLGLFDHGEVAVRELAFELAISANVPVTRLRDGLDDHHLPIRRHAAVALAFEGDESGRDILIDALAQSPSDRLIDALGAIGDDDSVVALGRCAMRIAEFAPKVIAVLRDLDSPRAERLADRVEADLARSTANQQVPTA